MFEQAVLSNGPASKRVWTTFAGVSGQALLVTFAVMIPMIWPEAMPSHQALLKIFVPTVPPGPPPKGDAAATRLTRAVPKTISTKGLVIPTSVPPKVQMLVDPLPAPGETFSSTVGVPGGDRNGIPGGLPDIFRSTLAVPAPPKPVEHATVPVPAEAAPIRRYREGGVIHIGAPVYRVEPRYPHIAVSARISGMVELEGVVGTDGRIRELKVKSGHPMLVQSALEAVRQWVYRPTTLNGDPVEVIAPITVNFRLN